MTLKTKRTKKGGFFFFTFFSFLFTVSSYALMKTRDKVAGFEIKEITSRFSKSSLGADNFPLLHWKLSVFPIKKYN